MNPENGKIEISQIFDTYTSSSKFENFIENQTIPKGHIIMAACKDDCMKKLSMKAKQWFRALGSSEIFRLKYRCSFAFIGRVGDPGEVNEARGQSRGDRVMV